MRPVIEYLNYREYIRDYYEERKARSQFSWGAFAERAGISSPVFLQYVCESKKNLSSKTAPQVAHAMDLVGFEEEYFCLLVAYEHGKSPAAQKKVMESLTELARVHKVRVLGAEEYKFFSSWKNSVIRELAPAMPGATAKQLSKASRRRISTAEVHDILEFLLQAGYLEQDENGNYHQVDRSMRMGFHSVQGRVKLASSELQRQMAELAVVALKEETAEGRDMKGLTLGITREAYSQIVEELAECRRRIVAIATQSPRTEEVYRLNMQFFPLTDMGGTDLKQNNPSKKRRNK